MCCQDRYDPKQLLNTKPWSIQSQLDFALVFLLASHLSGMHTSPSHGPLSCHALYVEVQTSAPSLPSLLSQYPLRTLQLYQINSYLPVLDLLRPLQRVSASTLLMLQQNTCSAFKIKSPLAFHSPHLHRSLSGPLDSHLPCTFSKLFYLMTVPSSAKPLVS